MPTSKRSIPVLLGLLAATTLALGVGASAHAGGEEEVCVPQMQFAALAERGAAMVRRSTYGRLDHQLSEDESQAWLIDSLVGDCLEHGIARGHGDGLNEWIEHPTEEDCYDWAFEQLHEEAVDGPAQDLLDDCFENGLFYLDGDVAVYIENPTREECYDFYKDWRGDDSPFSVTCKNKGISKYNACMTASDNPSELSNEAQACDAAGESCARACDSGNTSTEEYLC